MVSNSLHAFSTFRHFFPPTAYPQPLPNWDSKNRCAVRACQSSVEGCCWASAALLRCTSPLFLSPARCSLVISWRFSQREVKKKIKCKTSRLCHGSGISPVHGPQCKVGFMGCSWWLGCHRSAEPGVLWGWSAFLGSKGGKPLFWSSGLSHECNLLFSTSLYHSRVHWLWHEQQWREGSTGHRCGATSQRRWESLGWWVPAAGMCRLGDLRGHCWAAKAWNWALL